MLLSRKRLRETSASPLLRGPEELLAFKSSAATSAAMPASDGKRLLRDLASRDAVLELLARLREDREPHANMNADKAPETSRAHRSSQELFLSVVLEWQRAAADAARLESPTAAVFRHGRSFHSAQGDTGYASSSSSYASSEEDERDDSAAITKRSRHSDDDLDVSPTSVHHVPGPAVSPLRLASSANSSIKRIGIYTPRARQELLRKYMAKRARRLSQNKVRYGVRKTLANARPRVKGRFVKTETPLTAALVQQAQPPAPDAN